MNLTQITWSIVLDTIIPVTSCTWEHHQAQQGRILFCNNTGISCGGHFIDSSGEVSTTNVAESFNANLCYKMGGKVFHYNANPNTDQNFFEVAYGDVGGTFENLSQLPTRGSAVLRQVTSLILLMKTLESAGTHCFKAFKIETLVLCKTRLWVCQFPK